MHDYISNDNTDSIAVLEKKGIFVLLIIQSLRLLFLLASFELHKDGVADYTALLARECIKKGHNVAVLAWNDTFLDVDYVQKEAFEDVRLLRLSLRLPTKKRKDLGRLFLETFSPDAISIQMVCFGFHPRGWIFGLGSDFKSILPKQVPIHIMFHELWLGLATNHSWKEKVYGTVQYLAIRQLWKSLEPKIVHVSNAVYFSKLAQYKQPVHYLPLPSNVPVVSVPVEEAIWAHMPFSKEKREAVFVLLFFGTLHSGWDTKAFWGKMKTLAGNKSLCVVSAGGQGYGQSLWKTMIMDFGESIKFVKTGFLSVEHLSALLQFADCGISTTPLSLLGKSGSAMAMIEHGLPIVVTRNELRFDFPIQDIEDKYPNVYLWDKLESFEQLKRSALQTNRIHRIASKFLKDITLSF